MTYRFLPAAWLLTVAAALAQPTPARLMSDQTTYQPPVFTDPDRLLKIKAAFPVIEKMFRDHAAARNFPGMAFGIVVDGNLVYSGAAGFTDVAKQTPATPRSQFRIASMTKSLTAMAVLQLRDAGKLRLDDPASLYVPELAKLVPLTADAPAITVRHLLTHAAGFPEDNPWGDRQLAVSVAELTKFLNGGLSLSNVPGVTYEYANLGFALLGRIVTRVSGQPYQRYITDRILKPLGMTRTVWDYRQAAPDLLAHGYRRTNDQWQEETPLADGSWGAMGGLITTIDDFARYVALHQSAWPSRSAVENPVLRRASLREMHFPWNFRGLTPNYRYPGGRLSPMTSAYAYGLGWSQDGDGRVSVGHSGGLPGFGSQWQILPELGVGVIAHANLTYAGMGGINTAVLDTLVSLANLKPRQLPVSPILVQRKAQLVKLLPDWNGAEQPGIFAENFFSDQPVELRRKATQALFTAIGPVKRVGELMPENQLRGWFVIEGETGSIEVFFTLTPEIPALIQQLDVK